MNIPTQNENICHNILYLLSICSEKHVTNCHDKTIPSFDVPKLKVGLA